MSDLLTYIGFGTDKLPEFLSQIVFNGFNFNIFNK